MNTVYLNSALRGKRYRRPTAEERQRLRDLAAELLRSRLPAISADHLPHLAAASVADVARQRNVSRLVGAFGLSPAHAGVVAELARLGSEAR